MSTITLSCLVAGENPYENTFNIKVNKIKTISKLRNIIKKKNTQAFANIDTKDIKLQKVDISLKKKNKKLKLINTKININIKEDLGGE